MQKITGNLKLIKKINRALVLDTIRNDEPITKSQISKTLQLSRSTVSSIVEELIAKKFVFELGYGKSTEKGGRKGLQLGFNSNSAFGIGVDIGGTKISFFITDLDGNVILKEKFKSTNSISKIVSLIISGIKKAKVSEEQIVGLGVGVPSITNIKDGIVLDAYALGWTNVDLKKELERHFNFPIFINNDVNCAALGEVWLGSGSETKDIFFVELGTGVGSAIISGGNLVQGYNYHAGEIAYNISKEDIKNLKRNKLGDFGVLEKKISGKFLSQHGYTVKDLFDEYAKSNEKVVPIINNFIEELSINISNAVNLLNPEVVIIGGDVSESMEDVVFAIQEMVNSLTPVKTKVKLATLGNDSGGLGAISYAFQEAELSEHL